MKNKLKQVGLIGLLVGATSLGFSNANAQQSETGFWIRQRPTFTDYGATARDYWATVVDNNERADQTRNESYRAMNAALGKDDSQVELLPDEHGNYREMLKVGDNSYVALPKDYWETHTRKKTDENSIERKIKLEDKIIFTINRWIDINNNRLVDHGEFQGLKNNFDEGEDLKLIVHNIYNDEKKVRVTLYGPEGNILINSEPQNKIPPSSYLWLNKEVEDAFKKIFRVGGPGSYKAVVYFEDHSAATHDFEIKKHEKENSVNPKMQIPVLSELVSTNDRIMMINHDENGANKTIFAKNEQLGFYSIKKKIQFDRKLNDDDIVISDINKNRVYYNKAYGVYIAPKEIQ